MTLKSWLAAAALGVSCWMLHTSLIAPQGATPEKVVKSFLIAIQKSDFEKAKKYGDETTGKVLDMMAMMIKSMPEGVKKSHGKVTTVDCQIDGDKGVCKACCNAEGEALQDVPVQKINGKWLVSMTKEGMQKETPPIDSIPEVPED